MRFRFHRGTLDESMTTLVEVSADAQEFIDFLNKDTTNKGMGHLFDPFTVDDLRIFNQGPDTRIDWPESWLIRIEGFGVIGMSDEQIQGLTEEQIRQDKPSMWPGGYKFDSLTMKGEKEPFDVSQEYITVGKIFDVNANDLTPTRVDELMGEWEPYSAATGAEWFDLLKERIQAGKTDEALFMIDSLPPQLEEMRNVKKGHVVVPDAEHMTEQMVDASRGLHLYYLDGGQGIDCAKMREHLRRYAPWSEKWWPQWFKEEEGHLTKAGRAIVAHAMTIGGYQDPDARKIYFAKNETSERQRVWDKPQHRRIQITLKPIVQGEVSAEGGFVVRKPFIDAKPIGDGVYELLLTRADIVKDHRKKFKTAAVVATIQMNEDGKDVTFLDIEVNTKAASVVFQATGQLVSRW